MKNEKDKSHSEIRTKDIETQESVLPTTMMPLTGHIIAVFAQSFETDRHVQTVYILIRRRVLLCLNIVYTVCQSSDSFRHINGKSNVMVQVLVQSQ